MRTALVRLPRLFPEFEHQLHRLFCYRRSFHNLSRAKRRVLQVRQAGARSAMAEGYEGWTHEQLVARIQELERQRQQAETSSTTKATLPNDPIPSPDAKYRKPPKHPANAFDASKYSTRLIALKFAYLGQKYNGFEHHNNNTTPLPTIEEEIWKALVKVHLINPTPTGVDDGTSGKTKSADVNWDGCEYSKCGRTDRGVSAFGQVIGVRVRSNRPLPKPDTPASEILTENPAEEHANMQETADSKVAESTRPFDEIRDEIPYIQLLNRVLPPDIRIYAWCPNPPPDFSARFHCKERRYKYFFTNPCFGPVPGPSGLYNSASSGATMREGWIDIEKMRQACKELVGLHDFRHFCKIDASKQITNFKRRIFHADIEEISPLSFPSYLAHPAAQSPGAAESPKMYAFVLHGSAFLWHQVRSIVAILFLVGQGLEAPSLVPQLLDISKNPTRPKYEMASDAPLVLWDCIFPYESEVQTAEERVHGYEDRLEWVYVGDTGGTDSRDSGKAKDKRVSPVGRGKWGRGGVLDDVWELWRGNKIDETLSGLLLESIAARGQSTLDSHMTTSKKVNPAKPSPRIFDGSNVGRAKGNYIRVMRRDTNDPVELVNERWAKRKGIDPRKFTGKEDEADE